MKNILKVVFVLKNVAKNRRKITCVEKAFTLIVCFALAIDRKIWNALRGNERCENVYTIS